MFRNVLVALAPAALLAAPAFATPAPDAAPTVEVLIADLDLARTEHQALLSQRLERAAQTACARPFIRDLSGMVAYNQCVADALSAAHAQLAERTGAAVPVLAAR